MTENGARPLPRHDRHEIAPALPANQNALEDPPSRLSARTILMFPAIFLRHKIFPSCAREALEQTPSAACPFPSTAANVRRAGRVSSNPATGADRSTNSGPHWTALEILLLIEKRSALTTSTRFAVASSTPLSNRAFRGGEITWS